MYLKANGGKNGSSSKKIVTVMLFLLLAAVAIIAVIKLVGIIRFNMSLPDPDKATEMEIRRGFTDTVIFHCGDNSVACLGEESSFPSAMGMSGGHMDALFVETADDSVYRSCGENPYNFGTIDRIYVAAGADKAYIEDLKEYFYDSEIIQLKKKGEKFVAGEMVVRVLAVSADGIVFSVTHGYNTFLVCNDHTIGLKPLKDTRFDVAFAPYSRGIQLENVKYFICQRDGNGIGTLAEMGNICEQYFDAKSRDISGISDGKDVYFDVTFTVTGRLSE